MRALPPTIVASLALLLTACPAPRDGTPTDSGAGETGKTTADPDPAAEPAAEPSTRPVPAAGECECECPPTAPEPK